MINKFGQEVTLTIENSAGATMLNASGLRVDFDLRQVRGFNRGTISVYNLNQQTIKNLVGSDDMYATLKVRLHNGRQYTIMDGFYISNSINELMLPDEITRLYCYDSLKKRVLENYVNVVVVNPTLQNIVDQVLYAGTPGSATPPNTRYQAFPVDLKDYQPVRPITNLKGSVQACLKTLEMAYDFNMYTEKDGILMIYKPNKDQYPNTNIEDLPIVSIDSNNLRSNPKLAPAQLQVSSNLDPRIKPGSILDISRLITAAPGSDEKTLQIADNFAKKSVGGYTRYQSLIVQHKGSNYTASWDTTVSAVCPTNGFNMPTVTWFR